MDERYLSKLPFEIRSLVAQLEGFARKPIGVRQSPRVAKASCQLDAESATIYLRDLDAIDVAATLHELLHIQRNWPERAPMIIPKEENSEPLVQRVGRLDNQLEHLVIVPRQKLYGFDATAQWNAKLGEKLEIKFWEKQDVRDQRLNLLLTHLTIDFLVTDDAVRSAMRRILENEGLIAVAEDLSAEIRIDITDKERMTAAAARNFPFPPDFAQLIYFDPVNESERRVEIP